MRLRPAPLVWATFLLCVVACTNGGGLGSIGGSGGAPSPLPSGGIGVGIPTAKMGSIVDPVWGQVGGYTQAQTSQVLAFPPGSKVKITNLSSTTAHTFNVVATASSPPANFPPSPSLTLSPRGHGILGSGYASGILNPGKSVTVTLSNPGTYLFGCAFHYIYTADMRDVIQVSASATPGPTASPGPGGYAVTAPAPAAPAAAPQTPAQRLKLVDQTGRGFTLASLRGTPIAVTFIAARCTDACPLVNAQFADAARRIALGRTKGRLLTITLDPQRDTPRVMHDLAARFEANPRYWQLASGPPANVRAVLHAFGVVSIQGKNERDDEHTTFVYLFDSAGNLSKTLLASSALGDDLVDALRGAHEAAAR